MPVSTTLMIVIPVVLLVALIVAAGWHIWYALGLARVFAHHDTDPWRAWVPVLNEAELFRLGRVDPVKAALYLVPIVGVYALVLKAIAAHRLNVAAGRGGGATVLAVLLPPVWAMIAAQARPVLGATDERAAPAPAPAPAPGVTLPAPPAAAPATAAPPAPAGTIAPPFVAPTAAAPAAPVAPASAPGPVRSAATIAPEPPRPTDPAPLTRRALRDADDATAIVRQPAGWELLLPSGETVAVSARAVVLGRNPSADDSGVQYQAVVDEGRTVSKSHARLDWNGQDWTITDLGSTNGVAVVDAAGRERPVPAGSSAPVVDRFVLGDAVVVLRRAGV